MLSLSDHILSHTRQGRDIIENYFPESSKCFENKNSKFKMHDEKTASAAVKMFNGVWRCTDFGDLQKALSPFELVMDQECCTYRDALKFCMQKFSIPDFTTGKVVNKNVKIIPNQNKLEATTWELYEQIPESHLQILFAKKVIEYYKYIYKATPTQWAEKLNIICKRYNYNSCKHVTRPVKDGSKLMTITANDEYPVFLISYANEQYHKIYTPRNPQKEYRFMYTGDVSAAHMGGVAQCVSAYNKLINDIADNDIDASITDENKTDKPKKAENKLPRIIICAGEKDSINMAALDEHVVWLNSESAEFTMNDYWTIKNLCKEVLICYDLDQAGIDAAHKIGMLELSIKHVLLPPELLMLTDNRDNACKDIFNYLDHFSHTKLKALINVAIPYRFYYTTDQYDKNGNYKGISYSINESALYLFLTRNGFFKIDDTLSKTNYSFVQKVHNIIEKIDVQKIRNWLKNYMERECLPVELRNTVYRSTKLNETNLGYLDTKKIDFTAHSKDGQYFHFNNKTIYVTANDVVEYRQKNAPVNVLKNKIIDKKFTKLPPLFDLKKDEHGKWDLDYTTFNDKCQFLDFIMRTSMVYWENPATKEIRESFTNDEIQTHTEIFANKIYSIGYLLHRYKVMSRGWMVYCVDWAIPDSDEDNSGRSGKSIMFTALANIISIVTLNGRKKDLTKDTFLLAEVTPETDLILIDDADYNIDATYFYALVTGSMTVNPKFTNPFTLPFAQSAKLAATSNHVLRDSSSSTRARLLEVINSDYFHEKTEHNHYLHSWSPRDEYQCEMFTDWNPEQWNYFYNCMVQCLQYYLKNDKITAPMERLIERTQRARIGESFFDWADIYFYPDSDPMSCNLNKEIDKDITIHDCTLKMSSKHKLTPKGFTSKLKAWAQVKGYQYNPEDKCNATGDKGTKNRIIRAVDGKPKEFIYIKT